MKMKLASMVLVALTIVPASSFADRTAECRKVGAPQIEDGTVTSTNIKDGTIESSDFAEGAVNGDHITEFVTIKPFVLAAGESHTLINTGDLTLQANCYNYSGYDTATINVLNVTDGAILRGNDEAVNLTAATLIGDREVQRAAALTGVSGLDYATRFDVLGADGAFLKSDMYIGVNLRNVLGCHFGGIIHYTPAS